MKNAYEPSPDVATAPQPAFHALEHARDPSALTLAHPDYSLL
jgi:hypothetical protein